MDQKTSRHGQLENGVKKQCWITLKSEWATCKWKQDFYVAYGLVWRLKTKNIAG